MAFLRPSPISVIFSGSYVYHEDAEDDRIKRRMPVDQNPAVCQVSSLQIYIHTFFYLKILITDSTFLIRLFYKLINIFSVIIFYKS